VIRSRGLHLYFIAHLHAHPPDLYVVPSWGMMGQQF
jgi:hypothetical protein